MDPYNTMTLPYMGSPTQMQDLQDSEYFALQSYGQSQVYDASKAFTNYAPTEDFGLTPAPIVASDVRRFSMDQFNDPFAPDIMLPFDGMPADPQLPPNSSVEGNDKLLLFTMPVHHYTLADHSLNRTSISMSAKLDGSFLASESILRASPASEGPPPVVELTCYRRNLFQIEGTVIIPNTLRYIITDEGNRIPIFALELGASATESVEGQSAKIISVPWKTPTALTGEQPEEKAEKEPATFPLDLMSSQDPDSEYTTFPFSWRRLQFRNATANNGRRKELQQHYTLKLTIYATLSTGHKIALCDAVSGPIIVRGRSPRNFQSRKDVPISGSAVTSRRNAQSCARNSVAEASKSGERRSKSPAEKRSLADHSSPNSNANATASPVASPYANSAGTETQALAGGTKIPRSSVSVPHAEKRRRTGSTSHAPIPLSLSEDVPFPETLLHRNISIFNDRIKRRKSDVDSSPSNKRQSPPPSSRQTNCRRRDSVASSVNILSPNSVPQHISQSVTSPLAANNGHTTDIADILYEYFPLPPEDWQNSVDGVYRPHIVHHTAVEDTKTSMRNWSKTYFAGAGETA
ncbi:hypothetical protein KEM56_007331 [Ascosphaera pollenicola]|nr:hypothetical protein KEM56_007331 [Ascosphaera pollenicola]